ncbi:MAG TPA: hypothetical protein VMB03_31885 [Bryobacteraceae bacterium]|nr:hypothetical protein [Bryobacteraceae bacterium]
MRIARCLLPFLIALPAVQAAADTVTDLLPPDSQVVFGIRVHNLALSSIAQSFAAQAHAAAAGWLKAVPLNGVDFLRDIDEVLIASSGKGQTPPVLIVVTGHFDTAQLAGGAKRYYRDVPLLTGDDDNSCVALLDRGMALLGDSNLVHAAIDQRGGKSRIGSTLNDRITSLRQRYDIWGLGERPEGFGAPVPEAKIVQSIDRFQFGIQLSSGLELAAEVHARSAGDAEKLNSALRMIAALVKGQTTAGGSKFDLQADGGSLRLNLFIPEAELKKTIEAQAAALSPVTVGAKTTAKARETASAPAYLRAASAKPAAAPAGSAATAKPAAPKSSAEQDTVVFTLPGKK